MICKDCKARQQLVRAAWLNAATNPLEAIKQTAIGALELAGVKSKTGAEDLAQSKPTKRSVKDE